MGLKYCIFAFFQSPNVIVIVIVIIVIIVIVIIIIVIFFVGILGFLDFVKMGFLIFSILKNMQSICIYTDFICCQFRVVMVFHIWK